VNISRAVRAWRWRKKKDRTGQKKVKKGYISPIWGEAPTQAICIKNCVVGDLVDVITCTKFQNEIFGVTILQEVEFSIFLLIFEWALLRLHSLWSPYVIGQTIIFLPCSFFPSSSSFFSSPNLSGRRSDVCHTSTHGVALVRI